MRPALAIGRCMYALCACMRCVAWCERKCSSPPGRWFKGKSCQVVTDCVQLASHAMQHTCVVIGINLTPVAERRADSIWHGSRRFQCSCATHTVTYPACC
jgi:hypothetical protein